MNIQTNIATILFIIIPSLVGFSQEKPTSSWNLKDCIDYARKNNIQVQSAKVTQQSANVDLLQAKAQLFPSLTFSSSQGWGHQKTEQTDGKFKSQSAYTGSYTLNGGLTIYNGGKLTRSIRQQQITNTAQEYQVNMAENDIEIPANTLRKRIAKNQPSNVGNFCRPAGTFQRTIGCRFDCPQRLCPDRGTVQQRSVQRDDG